MMRLRRRVLLVAFKTFDIINMLLCLAICSAIVSHPFNVSGLEQFLSSRIKVQTIPVLAGFILAWFLVFFMFGLYRSKRLSPTQQEVKDIARAVSAGTVFIYVLGILCDVEPVSSPRFAVVFWATSMGSTILSRIVLRYGLGRIRSRGRNLRFLIVAGTNRRALQFATRVGSRKELGYQIVGFVDNDWPGRADILDSGYPVVSDIAGFSSFISQRVVDEVVICLPMKSFYDEIASIVGSCEEQGIQVRLIPPIFDLGLAKPATDEFEGEPLLIFSSGRMDESMMGLKRVIDVFAASLMLLILSPLFAAISILVKATSSGPVFFVQERVGINKRRFPLYKFRTMVQDAEQRFHEVERLNEMTGPVFKAKDDPRVVGLGRFLRKTSMDELPQLINVLKGDMSLVGPRPLPVRDYRGFERDWHRRRLSVRPGITCLWQVLGRNQVDFEDWMKLDMEYIDHWSLWLDLKILLMTIPSVLRGTGAR